MKLLSHFLMLSLICGTALAAGEERRRSRGNGPTEARAPDPLKRRMASILLSETFINEQIEKHLAQAGLLQALKVDFDPESEKMFMRGQLQLPIDDFRGLGIDPTLAQFKFQLTVKPRVSRRGSLVLEFPFAETFLYQASSKNPARDRMVIPVQLLSLGLASTRGYLAALSGDFSSFERKTAKLQALHRGIKTNLASETNRDAILALKSEKRSLELQIEATALQREQFERTSRSLDNILGASSDEEFDLNKEIRARENSIILRMKLGRIVPYLKDVELGGIRMNRSKTDNEDYFLVDLDSKLADAQPQAERKPRPPRAPLKVAPSVQIRMSQDIFNSKAAVEARNEKIPSGIKDFNVSFKDDGIHVTGKAKVLFFYLPFDSTVDFVSTAPDEFEVRLQALKVLGMNLSFLTSFALDTIKGKLDGVLSGVCTYEYLGEKNGSEVLRVRIDPKNLIPAFPDLHLVDVDVRDRSFVLRIGRTGEEKL